jgi:hypothetical protein
MKTHTTRFCAFVVLAVTALALAQRTEVRVRKGEVVAEMASQSVTRMSRS